MADIIFRKMSDNEDPYAVSSDDEEDVKKPPPKIQIEGKTSNIKDLVSLCYDIIF